MKKLLAAISLILVSATLLLLVSCGASADALSGTWAGTDPDLGDLTWTFDGKGNCTYARTDGFEDTGTYKIDGSTVSIQLSLWDTATVYNFAVAGTTLSLTDPTGASPDYSLTKK